MYLKPLWNYWLISRSILQKRCSSKYFQKLHWLMLAVNQNFTQKTFFIKSYTEKQRRNIFSLTAHIFHFWDVMYRAIPQYNAYYAILMKIDNFWSHNFNFSDFMLIWSSESLPAKKKTCLFVFICFSLFYSSSTRPSFVK